MKTQIKFTAEKKAIIISSIMFHTLEIIKEKGFFLLTVEKGDNITPILIERFGGKILKES
jgi:hypothetical protein